MTRFLPTIQRGVQLHQAGRLDEAATLYQQVLAQEPRNAGVIHLLGLIAHQRGRHAEAIATIGRAISIDWRPAEFRINLASALIALQRYDEALTALQTALQRDPRLPAAHCNLAAALTGLGRHDEAIASARQALALRPDYPEALMALAAAQLGQGHAAAAVQTLSAAVDRLPNHPGPMVNLADILLRSGHTVRAADLCRRAAALRPSAEALVNLGNALYELGQPEPALAAHRQAVALDPTSPRTRSNLLLGLNYSSALTPQQIFAEHQAYQSCVVPPRPQTPRLREANRALRIGYVSADFRRHSIAWFLEPILTAHDRAAFHITGYSNTRTPDDMTTRLAGLCDQFQRIESLDDNRAADLIRADRIDLLIDLTGHTQGNRLPVFARRPAPLQITYLGYPNSTGMAAMDYRITDDIADPPGLTDNLHSEKLARLPAPFLCYRPPDPSLNPPDSGPLPAATSGHITFGSFNHSTKITAEWLAVWARILSRVPDSRMVLKCRALAQPEYQAMLATAFAAHGIARGRLDLLPHIAAPSDHLATYQQIDIALDTFPYHGTTTTCEALFMGVPVITRAGATHVSRVGASLLTTVGLTDCITESDDAYVERAITLAADPASLAQRRASLRATLLASPLCNAPAFTRRLEALYRTLWDAA